VAPVSLACLLPFFLMYEVRTAACLLYRCTCAVCTDKCRPVQGCPWPIDAIAVC
jgi:hypothetical protein